MRSVVLKETVASLYVEVRWQDQLWFADNFICGGKNLWNHISFTCLVLLLNLSSVGESMEAGP